MIASRALDDSATWRASVVNKADYRVCHRRVRIGRLPARIGRF